MIYRVKRAKKIKLPFFKTPVNADFHSSAENNLKETLDIRDYLIEHKSSTYFVSVEGWTMKNAGISPGDLAVVDKAVNLKNNDIVVAFINGVATINRYVETTDGFMLVPENAEFETLNFKEGDDVEILGVVTGIIKKY